MTGSKVLSFKKIIQAITLEIADYEIYLPLIFWFLNVYECVLCQSQFIKGF